MTIGIAIILTITALSLLAPVLAPYEPDAQDFRSRLAPLSSSHWLGADEVGRDQLTRLMYAGRISLAVAFPSMAVALVLGVVIGGLAGFYAGWVDRILMRFTDMVLIFPTFFLLILAVATFGRSLTLLVLMIGLTAWPTNARVVRALMLNLRNRDFVIAARVNGARDGWIIVRHLVPQLTPVVIASATIRVANNILVESGLSFLGLGVSPPTPTWGNMVTEGADLMRQAWWLVAVPGATLFLVVMAFNLVGEGLRDLLDPRHKKR
jgi:peptide/nickel transport system permease protein